MRILLDTHIYLWWLEDSPLLSKAARKVIDGAVSVYVSSASLWEAMIKITLGKLEADPAELVAGIRASGFIPLPITPEHTLTLARLSHHHKDPFDRILIAQAVKENLRLVTHDQTIRDFYGAIVPCVW